MFNSIRTRFVHSNSIQQSSKHGHQQGWGINKSVNISRSQHFIADDNINETIPYQGSPQNGGHMAKNIRLVNGHFYPASQKSTTAIPSLNHRVTFQNDTPKQHPKTLTPSQSWTQYPPRQNAEVPKSNETKPAAQGNHEMSTEL